MGIKHTLYRLGFHLTAAIVDNLRTLILRQILDVLAKQRVFQKLASLLSGLIPADQPVYGLSGIFIQQQIKIDEKPFFISQKIADIPTPALVGTAQFLSNRRKRSAIVMPVLATHAHQTLGT